jgi:hypothetical protein
MKNIDYNKASELTPKKEIILNQQAESFLGLMGGD